MTSLLSIRSGRSGYHEVVQHVLKYGRRRAPRGLATLDAGWVTVEMHDPADSLPLDCGRGLSPAIAAVEAVQLIGGFSDPALTVRVGPRFERFVESDTHQFHGAYGVRVGNQIACALTRLRADPDSRQAVITLWDPWLDNVPGKRDYPCTVALRLSLWNDRLDLDVVMRSNDCFLGAPYDWWQFSQLQLTCARVLDVPAGVYRHTAWSLHIYESDVERAEAVTAPTSPMVWSTGIRPMGLGRPGDSIHAVALRARALAGHGQPLTDPTISEEWYRDRLAPHLG